jgi:hypothetical protein
MMKDRNMKQLSKLIAFSLFAMSSVAHATIINDTSDDFTVNWSKSIDATHTLKASANFDVISFTSTKTIFDITLSNLTNSGNFNAAIMAFGLYTDNELQGASITNNTTGATWNLDTSSGNFPGGFHDIDLCLFAANNCSGGNINQGLQAGQTDSFRLSLSYLSARSLILDDTANSPIKFQTQNGSFEFAGTDNDHCDPVNNVPEPNVLWMIAIGILGLTGFSRRHSNQMRQLI